MARTFNSTVTRRLISSAGLGVRHGDRVSEPGDFFDLAGDDAMLRENPADGIGAVGGDFPIPVILADGGVAAFGVAFQFDDEVGVAGDFPGERGEDPFAVGGEFGGLRLENRFVRAVKNIDA